MRRQGFTLIEIIIVLGIVMVLAALLFPVFQKVRRKGYQAACTSNLRQIGVGLMLYIQDNDDLFPLGGDPTDIKTDVWQNAFNGEFNEEVEKMRPLPLVLQPFVKNLQLWHCPADIGFDFADTRVPVPLKAHPSSFATFNTSYYYRTEVALRRRRDLTAFESNPPYTEHGASEINVLFDGKGNWHGEGVGDPPISEEWRKGRYNVLMADGHIENMTADQFDIAWRLHLTHPNDSQSN